jgi:L-fuconolactonase
VVDHDRIDAHQHFWRLDRGDYGWLTPEKRLIYRDFGPEDLAPLLARADIAQTVLVQAAPTTGETLFLFDLAAVTPFVAGVIGWGPFDAPDGPEILASLAENPALKGFRPMIHDIPDLDWILRPAVGASLRVLETLGLTFDALIRPPHLPNLRRVLDRHPDLRVVIDHAAKPEIAAERLATWAVDMRALARETTAWVKLSGLLTEAGPDWSVERLRPYVDHLLEHFGPTRLIFGSDWPVVTLAASYGEWLTVTEALLAALDSESRSWIMGRNARECYRLQSTPSLKP